MKANIGKTDKIVRLLIAFVLVMLFMTHQVEGTAGIILLILGIVLVLTSLINFCPLYLPFKINTKNKEQK